MPFNMPSFARLQPNTARIPEPGPLFQSRDPYAGLFRPPQEPMESQALRSVLNRSRIPSPQTQLEQQELATPHLDAYSEYLKSMPQRGNASLLQKILAATAGGLTGFAEGPSKGLETTQGLLELPYRRAMEDWMTRGEGLKNAATLENRNLTQENAFLKNRMAGQYQQGRLGIMDEQNEIARERLAADIDRWENELATRLKIEGMRDDRALAVAREQSDSRREAAGIQVRGQITAAQIGARSRENVAGIQADTALTLGEMGAGPGGMPKDPAASFLSQTRQSALANLASEFPDVIVRYQDGWDLAPPEEASTFSQGNIERRNQAIARLNAMGLDPAIFGQRIQQRVTQPLPTPAPRTPRTPRRTSTALREGATRVVDGQRQIVARNPRTGQLEWAIIED